MNLRPAVIWCRGYSLYPELLDEALDGSRIYEYRHPNPAAPFIMCVENSRGRGWSAFCRRRGPSDADTWQELVRLLERRSLGERVSAATGRAWRWVKEVLLG